jgi:hypothetical protein
MRQRPVSPQWPALHGELARFDGIFKRHGERVSEEGQGGGEAEKEIEGDLHLDR